jgi:hypothetical protein
VDDIERMSLTHEKLGSLPVVNSFLTRLRLTEILDRYLPVDDARLRVAPATIDRSRRAQHRVKPRAALRCVFRRICTPVPEFLYTPL